MYWQKTDIKDLSKTICTLAHQNDIEKIVLKGGKFCEPWVDAIKTTYTLNYGENKNLEIEVM